MGIFGRQANHGKKAARLLCEYPNGSQTRKRKNRQRWGGSMVPKPQVEPFSERDRTVMACIQVGKKHRLEQHIIARKSKGWTRPEWDEAHHEFQCSQLTRMHQRSTETGYSMKNDTDL